MILLDTNVVIYAANPLYPDIIKYVAENDAAVSVIAQVEALGFPGLTLADRASLEGFFAVMIIHPIDERVVEKAIELRQRRKMGLGDAFVAATAIVHRLPLATCDVSDFKWIPELDLRPLVPR